VFSAASVCQFVCLSVTSFICQHDNFRTIERKMMKLNGWVHCTKISTEFEFGGRRSKVRLTRDKKRQGAAFLGSSPCGCGPRGPCVRFMFGKLDSMR